MGRVQEWISRKLYDQNLCLYICTGFWCLIKSRSQSYQTLISLFFQFLLLSLAFLKHRQYFLILQTLKLNNKKRKKSMFYEEKSLVRLTPGSQTRIFKPHATRHRLRGCLKSMKYLDFFIFKQYWGSQIFVASLSVVVFGRKKQWFTAIYNADKLRLSSSVYFHGVLKLSWEFRHCF